MKAIRLLRGLSQGEVAEKVFLSRASIANIESGIQGIRIDNLYAIAEALQVTVIDLLAPNFYETLPYDEPMRPEPVTIQVLVDGQERMSFRVPKYGRVKGDG